LNDLFGAAPAAPATPAEGEAAAEAPAAEAPAADPLGDLFGTPAATEQPAAPAEPAAPAPAEAAPAAETPAAAPAASDNELNDLFGAPATSAKVDQESVEKIAESSSSVTPELLPMRTWTDNTGNFSVVGRLIEIKADGVRLAKENGRTCSVPMRRLSQVDADYVQQIAASHGQGVIGQFVAR
jgi:hypothetical protein